MISCVSSGFLHIPSVFNIRCVQLFVLFIPPPTARQKNKVSFWWSEARQADESVKRKREWRERERWVPERSIKARDGDRWQGEDVMKQWDRDGKEEAALERKGSWWRDVRCGGEAESRVESDGMIAGGVRSLSPPADLWLHQNKHFYLSDSARFDFVLPDPQTSSLLLYCSFSFSSARSLAHFQCIIQAWIPERRAWPLKKHEGYTPGPLSATSEQERHRLGWRGRGEEERNMQEGGARKEKKRVEGELHFHPHSFWGTYRSPLCSPVNRKQAPADSSAWSSAGSWLD